MNVLLTSVGRRGYLVNYFKEALSGTGKVFAANSEVLASGMAVADKSFVVPQVDSESYIPHLLEICRDHEVRLVVSLFDIDLPYLAREKERFRQSGIELVVSDPWIVEVANDKWKTHQFFRKRKFNVPRTFLSIESAILSLERKEICFPVVIKPRWGMGSIALFVASSIDELVFFYGYAAKEVKQSYLRMLSFSDLDHSVIIQEYIRGDEYGLDVFNGLKGNHLVTVPKRKLAMRAGETDIAMAVYDESLLQIGEDVSRCFRHPGNMDVDVFKGEDGKNYILEINARFGGGYPFSHCFGVNMVKAIVDEVNGRALVIGSPVINRVALKSINIVILDDGFGS